MSWNPFHECAQGLRVLLPQRTLRLTACGVAYFWCLALLLTVNLLFYGKNVMDLKADQISYLNGAVSVGIGLGSALAGLFSRKKVELGLVPIGALGMAFFSILLFWTWRLPAAFTWTLIDLGLLGLFGGFFIVPLQALL